MKGRVFTLFLGVGFFSPISYSSLPPYYYCHFNKNHTTSAFDHIFKVEETKSGEAYLSQKWWGGGHIHPIEIYNENKRIIGVYKKGGRSFKILQLDLAGGVLRYYNADYMSKKDFQKLWGRPYREKDFHLFNTHPEMLKYLPQKSNPEHLALANLHSKRYCNPMGYMAYPYKVVWYFIIGLLSI